MAQLTVLNLTNDTVLLSDRPEATSSQSFLLPYCPTTLRVSKRRSKLTLRGLPVPTHIKAKEQPPQCFRLPSLRSASGSFGMLMMPKGCPWMIYYSKISTNHRRLFIFPWRDTSCFLSEMPDHLPLSSLLLPGTHDTMAFYGWPVSQCQSLETPLSIQLASGIRVLDVRLALIEGRLISYHGIYPQRTPFLAILETVHAFLTNPSTCRETLVMSIKQEDFTTTPPSVFSTCVRDEIMGGPGGRKMWFLENRVPTLGEVRGKVLLFSRFGGDGQGWEGGAEGLGMHPNNWPDSEKFGFTWWCKDTLVRTHDWYAIPSFLAIPEKVELATQILLPPPTQPPFPLLSITYFSAASFPLAFPTTVARGFGYPQWGLGVEGVNSRVGKWLLDLFGEWGGGGQEGKGSEPKLRGWTFIDFYSEPKMAEIVPLLVECNFRGRGTGV